MMYFIMLPCYLIILGAYIYTINYVAKPDGYLLLGVKIPKEEMQREEIQQMVKKYKKRSKYLIVGMFFLTYLGFFIREYPIISTIYCLVNVFLWLGGLTVLLNKSFDELYTYKKEQGWVIGETYTISVDTEVARLKSHFLFPKWHWFIIVILTVISCFGWVTNDSGGGDVILMLVNASISLTLFVIYCIVPRVKSTVYSDNSEINVALNRCYCYELTKAMVLSAYSNAVSWFVGGLFPNPVYNSGVIIGVALISTILICVFAYSAFHKVSKERNLLSHAEKASIETDEDIYWRGGQYNNPNDPKLWVEKRIGFGVTMNMARPAGKVMGWIATLIIVGCFAMLIYFLPLDFPSLSLTMDSDKIYINATRYDTEITFNDITEAKLITELPKLYKNNGMATDAYDLGAFRAKEYGQSKVYINKEQPKKYLVIYAGKQIYFMNSDREEELNACIEELQKRGLMN